MDPEEKSYFSISSSNFPSGSSSASLETSQTCSIPIGSSSFDPFLSPHPIGFSGSPMNFETFSNIGVPQPVKCLYGTLIPPFLSKTYELVEDPELDPIISWATRGGSFVVWEPVEFARIVLPRNFKHDNFSSFVRQLNTYGFRKIDPDKWEFANELFLRGKKHLLRNIHRRKSSNGSSAETPKSIKGSDIESLRKEKSALMHQVVELQQQQRGTAEHMEMVKHRLKASEKRQKQMVSFLAKVVQNPVFLDRLKQMKERNSLGSPRTKRKFLQQKQQESGTTMEGQIVRYRPELGNLGDVPCPEIAVSDTPDFLFQDRVGKLSTGVKNMPFQIEDAPFDDLATTQLLNTTSSDIGDLFSSPQPEAAAEYLVSPSEELAKERTIPEFSFPGIENIIKHEDVWSMGYDLSAGMFSSSPGLWGNGATYHVSDILDLGSLAAGSSGIENWLSDESPLG